MYDEISILYSILESRFYDHQQIISWVDDRIADRAEPSIWLFDLSLTNSIPEAQSAILNSSNEYQIPIEENSEIVTYGLIILMFRQERIDGKEMKLRFFEQVDGSSKSLPNDPPECAEDLQTTFYQDCEAAAVTALQQIGI